MSKFEDFEPRPAVAYMLVIGAVFLWAASTVVGRGVHETIPPMGMTFWRWGLAALVLLPLIWRQLPAKWPMIKAHAGLIMLLGLLQVGSSSLLFLGVNYTTAINATLLNAAQPALTVIPAWILTRDRVTPGQGIGIAIAMFGIAVMISRGDLEVVTGLQFNIGDLYALAAIIGWSFYASLLHRLPREIGFTTTIFLIFFAGSALLLPFYLYESITIRTVPFTFEVVGIIALLGIIVSLGSVAMWNAALRSVGPNRATIFLNLIPVFGAAMAIVFLGEQLRAYHMAGAGLVAGGIVLVILKRRKIA